MFVPLIAVFMLGALGAAASLIDPKLTVKCLPNVEIRVPGDTLKVLTHDGTNGVWLGPSRQCMAGKMDTDAECAGKDDPASGDWLFKLTDRKKCNANVTFVNGTTTYEYTITRMKLTGAANSSISRFSCVELKVKCFQSKTQIVASSNFIDPAHGEINNRAPGKAVNFSAALGVYADSSFKTPLTKVDLGGFVFVKAKINDNLTDTLLGKRTIGLRKCFATSTLDAKVGPKYEILGDDGCVKSLTWEPAASGNRELIANSEVDVNASFKFKAFAWVKSAKLQPASTSFFVHCTAVICVNGEDCTKGGMPKKKAECLTYNLIRDRRSTARKHKTEPPTNGKNKSMHISAGPFYVSQG